MKQLFGETKCFFFSPFISGWECSYEIFIYLFSSSIYLDKTYKEKEKRIRLLQSIRCMSHVLKSVIPSWCIFSFSSIKVLSVYKKKKKKLCDWHGSKGNINLKLYLICINSFRRRNKKCSINCWPRWGF